MKKLHYLLAALLLAACHGGNKDDKQPAKSEKGTGQTDGKQGSKNEKSGEKGEQGLQLDSGSQQRAGLTFQTLNRRSIHGTLYASSRISMNEERTAHVGVITDGRITELRARIGDTVRRGQVLGRFHSHDVHEAVAAYQTALTESRRRQNALSYAQVQRDRYHRLFDLKSASRQETEQAEASLAGAQSDLKAAQIQVEKERVHLTEILQIPIGPDGSIDEASETVPITSPIAGVVIARPITLGAVVSTGTEAFTIADLSSVWVIASVNETDTGKLRIGLPASVKVEAFSEVRFHGTLTYLGKELDPATRTLQARVLVPNPGQRLRPEMYAAIEFPEPQTREALFVPEEALQDINGNTVVFVRKESDHFEAKPVTLGERDAGQVEVKAGLKPGDQVVVKCGFLLKSQMLRGTLEGG